MSTTLTSRIAALGAALAVGTAGLVAVGPTADAAAGQRAYVCTTAFGSAKAPVSFDVKLPKSGKRGDKVKARKAIVSALLPADMVDLLRELGVTEVSGRMSGAEVLVGRTPVRLRGVSFVGESLPPSGPLDVKVKGSTSTFRLTRAGTVPVSLGKSFRFSAQDQDGNALIDSARCGLQRPDLAEIGSIEVSR